MKALFISFIIFSSIALKAQVNESNGHAKNPAITNKVLVSTLDGKPISYFLNHRGIDKSAKRFYRGEIGINNIEILRGVLDSLIACSSETKPFYLFVFNQIVDLSSGNQEELVAKKCRDFVETFPCEFFQSFNQPEMNINVVKWTNYIGITLKDKGNYAMFRSNIDSKIKTSCPDTLDLLKSFMSEVRMCLVK